MTPKSERTNEQTAVHSDSVHINRSLISLAAPSIAAPLHIRPMQKLAKLARCFFSGRVDVDHFWQRAGEGGACAVKNEKLEPTNGLCEFAIFPQDC